MNMSKEELVEFLSLLDIPFNEGIQNDKNTNSKERIVFWDYVWDSLSASGKEYNTLVTYQVSFFSLIPRNPKLVELKRLLNEKGINPTIYHEFDQERKEFHSYFSIEVLEKIG